MRPRIRTIKPEAFSDEKLWDLGVETGLPVFQGFAGLWTVADREGRFEWRPRALKPLVLPHWTGDFGEVLDALASVGLIVRYEVDGRAYGLVPNFLKHQVINTREAASVLPGPGCELALGGSRAAPSRTAQRAGYVYVAVAPGSLAFKVGWSERAPADRVADLSAGSPVPLELIDSINGTASLETDIHHALAEHLQHREWFAASDASVAILGRWFTRARRVLDACSTRHDPAHDASGTRAAQVDGGPPVSETNPDTSTRDARVRDACVTRHDSARGEGKGREGKGNGREREGSDAGPLATRERLQTQCLRHARAGYAQRFEAALGMPASAAALDELKRFASWVVTFVLDTRDGEGQEPEVVIDRILDAFFARTDSGIRKCRYRVDWLLEDPGRYLEAHADSEKAARAKERAEARRTREVAEERARQREIERNATLPPPGLSKLVGAGDGERGGTHALGAVLGEGPGPVKTKPVDYDARKRELEAQAESLRKGSGA